MIVLAFAFENCARGTDCLRCKIHDFDVVDELLSVNLATLSDVAEKERERDMRVHISCICRVKSKMCSFLRNQNFSNSWFYLLKDTHYFFYLCLYVYVY